MLVREMEQKECQDLLVRLSFGRLACVRDNCPYIVPIYFAAEPHRLFAFATMGQKIEWMRSNPQVCIEVDEVKSHTNWSSVVVQGRYEEFPDTAKYAKERQLAQTLMEKRSMWWQIGFAAAQTRGQFDRDIPVFFCIHIDKISGRHATTDPVEASLALESSR